ncbi:MAG: zinc-dependent peptidase [Acidobacteria bacterium]|nr:zinc-dependent peptidase [Acidobacteriota bacterium]
MIITSEANRRNKNFAIAATIAFAIIVLLFGWIWLPGILLLGSCPLVFWLIRRHTVRRLMVLERPFPKLWEQILVSHVAFYRALPASEKNRFRQMIQVFLDEVRVTGIGTNIDDTIRVLVAASAAIPIFGFHDWEYHRLGEVLIYPESFGKEYQASKREDSNILGLTGLHQLRGVMILSKSSLLAGFDGKIRGDNVGIHEFAHLVEVEENEHGIPMEVSWEAVNEWVKYVGRELSDPKNPASIRGYAYTNDHEFFAVLSEYFFKSPVLLKEKDPELYRIMRAMFHQDTASLLAPKLLTRRRYKKNAQCPCGSGKRYKNCCLMESTKNI